MQGFGWLSFLLIGLIAGWIAEQVMNRSHGLLTNLIVGVIGAYLGAFLFSLLGLGASGFIGALVVATIGAIVLLAIVGFVRGRT
ncbi:GlsB/YeaQ/YmgE family stress response membrane protein [Amaricoccus solimangrovi]|uniref:GlsB/YeaQ/YmgE family stress response membrane protein n=1 Tax=Amaricoccus solimangrovi TaxID=2589815 RepID=A0A501WZ20_9RHOB|nr:GlsB/YeaQ/YmgE family stress response membrane protein [Amaricoccus solimangrovi]TPE53614.1 GlsB/YeaQ/YmgE family stress response membrane protein [Amaricoccus solimangrovi]